MIDVASRVTLVAIGTTECEAPKLMALEDIDVEPAMAIEAVWPFTLRTVLLGAEPIVMELGGDEYPDETPMLMAELSISVKAVTPAVPRVIDTVALTTTVEAGDNTVPPALPI